MRSLHLDNLTHARSQCLPATARALERATGAVRLMNKNVDAHTAAVPKGQAMSRTVGAPLMRSVLCVEEGTANLSMVLQQVTQRSGLCLLQADTPRHGVGLARQSRPDVILMDIELPGLSGLQALALLAEEPATARIPVIALSASATPGEIEAGLAAGFFRYLSKPVQAEELMHTLDLALGSSSTHRAHVAAKELPC